MPDDATLATVATETAAEPSASEATDQVQAATAEAEKPTAQTTEPDIWDRIAELDPEEIAVKHPKLHGKVGELAQKQARKLIEQERAQREAQWQSDFEQRQKQAELDRLLEEDPLTFAEKVKEHKAQSQQEQAALQREMALTHATWGEVDSMLHAFHYTLPEPVQKELSGKNYDGTPSQARKAYLDDVVQTAVKHQLSTAIDEAVKKARAKWEKEELPARVKERLGELNGADESPDLNGGSSTGNKRLTWKDVEAMSPDEYNRRANEIFAQIRRR